MFSSKLYRKYLGTSLVPLVLLALCFSANADISFVGGGGGGGGASTQGPGTTSPKSSGAKCDVRTVIDAAMNSASSTVTSATAAFTQQDVGKLACVSGSGASTATVQTSVAAVHVHTCGTVSAVTNSTTATLSFTNGAGANISGQELTLGTDDHTALQNMFTNLGTAGGGTVVWPPYACGTSVAIAVPADQRINIKGAGYQVPSWGYNPGVFYSANNGSTLWVGTDALTVSALQLDSQAASSLGALAQTTVGDNWENFSLRCGAGVDKNCGNGTNANGVNLNNIFRHDMDNVAISNFSGAGIVISTTGTGNTQLTNGSYSGLIRLSKTYIFGNGQQGVAVNMTGTSPVIQNLNFVDTEVENNGAEGFKWIQTANVGDPFGITFRNSIWQRDGTNGGITYEINFNGVSPSACEFDGANYFEADASASITKTVSDRSTSGVCTYAPIVLAGALDGFSGQNVEYGQGAEQTAFYFLIMKPQALATEGACGAGQEGAMSCVNNLTACTNGTTAATSGTTHCVITCNGTNWIESGLTC